MSETMIDTTTSAAATDAETTTAAAPGHLDPPSRTHVERGHLAERVERMRRRRAKLADELLLAERAWEPYAGTQNPGEVAGQVLKRLSDVRNEAEGLDGDLRRAEHRLRELDELLGASQQCREIGARQVLARRRVRDTEARLQELRAARAEELDAFNRAMTRFRERLQAEVAARTDGSDAPSGRRPVEPAFPQVTLDELDAAIVRIQAKLDDERAMLAQIDAQRLHSELVAADFALRERLYEVATTVIHRAALREAAGLSSLSSALLVKIDESDPIFERMIELFRGQVARLYE